MNDLAIKYSHYIPFFPTPPDAETLVLKMPSLSNSTSSVASPPPASDSFDGAAAERRLREAEDRLREAIEELQRRQRRAKMLHPPCDHADESCVANAIGNLCQSFLLSYGVRVGIGILLRAFKLARRKSYSSLLDLKVQKFVRMIDLRN